MIYQTALIVLGGGPGGLEAAVEGARMGLHVTLIERGEIGGTCREAVVCEVLMAVGRRPVRPSRAKC